VIDSVRYLRQKKGLDDQELGDYLRPFWLTWTGCKRKDGRHYDPQNITWLTDWASNGDILPGRDGSPPKNEPEDVDSIVERWKNAGRP
jgi:hypothetical protein